MNKPEVILIGAGGHAHACIDVIEQQGRYHIAGLIGMPEEMHACHQGYRVIATDEDLPELAKSYQHAFIALGQILSPDGRIRLYQRITGLGFALPLVVSPTAYVSRHAVIGIGSIVMHGAIVNAGARVGNNCIINSRALVEHDVTVEDHCHVSTGSILNGDVKIGEGSFIGSGALIREGVSVGRRCIVGMGVCLRHTLADQSRCVSDT